MIEINKDIVKEIIPKRIQNSHKGDYGKVLCITGSKKYPGAGILSAMAVLKSGAGYSILCSEDEVFAGCAAVYPDLIFQSHRNFNANFVKQILEKNKVDSIVLGCGITTNEYVVEFVDKMLDCFKEFDIPVVLDADALNCIAVLNRNDIKGKIILTPHPKELSRLIGVCADYIQADREHFLTFAQEKYASVILLKGYNTLISDNNDKIYKNTTGNSCLAKAGTGDVLAGLIGGFLAQKVSPVNATILAAYIHGLAADLYAEKFGEYSMLASDLLNFIPMAFKKILR